MSGEYRHPRLSDARREQIEAATERARRLVEEDGRRAELDRIVGNRTSSPTVVDRDTPQWQRVRAACCDFSGLDDLDRHADSVLALLATTSPPGAGSTVEGPRAPAPGGRRKEG